MFLFQKDEALIGTQNHIVYQLCAPNDYARLFNIKLK